MSYWLGVASRSHIQRGMSLGIAQIGHGKREGLAKMHRGDWIIYYAPRHELGDSTLLQHFVAIGEIEDDTVWQADEGDFKPWRRRVQYRQPVQEVPVTDVRDALDLTQGANWGYQLRRGLIPLSAHDFATLSAAMNPA